MQATQILAGYTLGGADLLRRAMGKKKLEEMVKQREAFVAGCASRNQISAAKANEVFDLLEKFAGYGFNKSHAAAYAVVAYQTAYLKANYPVEFLSAMMTNDQADLAKLALYIGEAKGFGIDVLGPDVNESDVMFAPVARPAQASGAEAAGFPPIRFGLAAIKGVGEVAVQSILEARRAGGRFTSLQEFCERVDMRSANRKVIECLIKTGACDSLGANRATLWASLDHCLGRANAIAADRARGQSSLFDAFDAAPKAAPEKPVVVPEWPAAERLAAEKELLGFYVSGHPLQPFEGTLRRYALHTVEGLAGLANRSMARFGGLVGAVQQGVSKKSGKPYAMVTVEDMTGSVQLLCMNESFDRFRELFVLNTPLMVTGEVNTGEDRPKVFPVEILRLDDAPRKYTRQVQLRLRTEGLDRDRLEMARRLCESHPGTVPVMVRLQLPGGEMAFIEPNDRYYVTASAGLESEITDVLGPGTYFARADTSLPERAQRKWERKGSGGGGGDDE
jgi:DNA polymerase-3 subunit alpha